MRTCTLSLPLLAGGLLLLSLGASATAAPSDGHKTEHEHHHGDDGHANEHEHHHGGGDSVDGESDHHHHEDEEEGSD